MQTRRRRQGAIAIFAALGAFLIAFPGCGDLSRSELDRGVESLSALAAQGELIANGVARDATKSTYTRVMAKTLGGEAEHEAEKLADAEPSPEVGDERDAAVRVAAELADLFSELQTFPGDEHHGELIEEQMGEVKSRSDAIVERLTGEEP